MSGGKEKLDEIIAIEKGGSFKAKHKYAEVRTVLDALQSGQLNIKIGTHIFATIGTLGNLTEIDVLTQDEMIEVKSGGGYNDAKKLSGRDFDQFLIFRDIFNGKRKVFDRHGNLLVPPKKWIHQFREPNIDPKLKKWLLDKGVTEVREGK